MRSAKQLKNLTPIVAKDGAKDLRRVSVRIPKALLDGLSRLPGDRSVKIRAAIAQYLRENKSQNTP